MRRECREISWGQFRILRTNARDVLVLRYDWRDTALVILHNFSDNVRRVDLAVEGRRGNLLVDVFARRESQANPSGTHRIELGPYGYEWFRVGAADNTLDRAMY
jgi:maltose alpha-D-glucosyltransferase/alpha-amylase